MSTTPPQPPRRRWRRWLFRLLVVAVVARLLLALFLPQLLAFGASFAGLRATMRSASLSLLGLSLRLEDLELRSQDHPNTPPLLIAHDVAVQLSLRQLLRGQITVVDAVFGGAVITLHRENDGSLALPPDWLETVDEKVVPPADGSGPVSFALPAQIVSLRLHDVVLRWLDQTATPPRDERCAVDIDAVELGYADRAGKVSLRLHSPRWIDDFWIEVDALTSVSKLQLDWRAIVRGVRPAQLPLPRELAASLTFAHAIDGDLRGSLTGTVHPAAPRQPTFAGEVGLELRGDGSRSLAVEAKVGPSTASGDTVQLPFQAVLQAPELVQQLELQAGELQLGPHPSVRGKLLGSGITLARLRPLLAPLGLSLPAAGLRAQLGFEAEFGERLSLQLRDVELGADDDRFALTALDVRDLHRAGAELSIGSIEIIGPQLAVTRTAASGWQFAGATFAPPAPTVAAADPAPAPAVPALPRLPRLRLGNLTVRDGAMRFVDQTLSEPATLLLSGWTMRGDAWTIGALAPPGRLSLQARLDGAIEALRLDATLLPSATAVGVELQLQAEAITLQSLRPWLQSAGLQPKLADGSLSLVAGATVTEVDAGLDVTAQVANLRYRAGEAQLLGVRAIAGRDLQVRADHFALGSWQIDEPFLDVNRTADGDLELLGICLASAPAHSATAGATTAPPPVATPSTAAPQAGAPLRHGPLRLQGAVVQVRTADQAPLRLGLDAELAAHQDTAPQAFTAALRFDGAVDRANLRGSLQQRPLALALELDVQGLRGQGLQRFLPPHWRCTLMDGSAAARLQLRRAAAPGSGLQLEIDGVQLRDRDQELVGFDRLELDVPELSAERLHIKTLIGVGLRGQLTLGELGLHVPGFLLTGPAPVAAPPDAPTAAEAPPLRPPLRIPLLQIDRVDVATALVLQDRRAGDGAPLQLTGRLTMQPWAPRLDRDEPEPARMLLTGTALPLCRELRSELVLHLYELAPHFELQFTATDIDCTAVPKLLPALAAAAGTTDRAELRGRLHGRLDLKRRDPRTFDLDRAFGGELLLEDVELRDTAHDRSLASLGSIDVIARAIDPRTGDTLLRAIEIDRPQLVVDRTAEGAFELFGMRLPPRPPVADADATDTAPATTPAALPAAGTARPEFAIDRLVVQGAALHFTDHTTTPPTPLPLADGELELLRFSTLAFTEPRPLRLRASVRGGDVPLERRVVRSSLLAGLVASTAAAVGGAADQHQIESRAAVDEISLRGDLVLAPHPTGQLVAEVHGLELPLLRGFAKQGGIDLADGLLDHRTTVDLRGADGTAVDSRNVFTWLSISEPPGGPISTYLRLPAPLDSVLFLLRNDADEHRIPVQLVIPSQGASSGAIVQAAAEAVIKVLADAVASAAFRTTGMLTGAIGLSGGAASTASGQRGFDAGDPLPSAGDLAPVLLALADDPMLDVVLSHEVGAADLARAEVLATPAPAQIAARAEELRQQRLLLQQQREPLAAELLALYAGGKPLAARALQARLLAHDDRLGELERTLDEAMTMLAGGDPRARQRRTQAALQAMASARLDAVAHELRVALPGLATTRIVRRQGRPVPTAGLDRGGRVAATVRRRSLD